MKISEAADLFGVSTETLLDVIATEVYELDVDFSSRELPEDVLSYLEEHPNGSANGEGDFEFSVPEDSVPEWIREGLSSHEGLGNGIHFLVERGKIGLGLLAVLVLSESHPERIEFIRKLLRDLGGEVARSSYETVSDKVSALVGNSTLSLLGTTVPLLSGLSSIYGSVLTQWLASPPVRDIRSPDSDPEELPKHEDSPREAREF